MLFWNAAQAQNGELRGRVTDESGQPLPGANILVKGTVLGAAADGDGHFVIKGIHTGNFLLVVSMIGYNKINYPVEVQAGVSKVVQITLREAPIQTGEVVITAGKHAQSLEEVPVSMIVVSHTEIESRPINELDDVLRYIPGVNVTESQVNIRGSSGYSHGLGSRVLLLLDGVPLLAGDAGEIKFDALPLSMVERVEVVKGAGSALYGSSALGGVINIITKGVSMDFARVRTHCGLYDSPSYPEWKWWGKSPRFFSGIDLQKGTVFGDLEMLLSGGVRHNQGYRLNDDYMKWNLNAKVRYKFTSDKQLSVSANYASNTHGNWVFWRDINHALIQPATTDLSETIVSKKLQLSTQFNQTFSSSFAQTIQASYYLVDYDTRSDTSDFSLRPTDKTQSTAHTVFVQWQGTLAVVEHNLLVLGFDGNINHVDSRTYGVRNGYSAALYAQDSWTFLKNASLSLGARYDYSVIDTTTGDGQLNPRVGITYSIADGTTLRSSYGLGFRSPSIAERFATASAGSLLTKPNPNLLAEKSTSYEIGVNQQFPIPVELDVAVFQNEYRNLVEPSIDPLDGRIFFNNITRAKIRGIEVLAKAGMENNLFSCSLGYTFMDTRDLKLGKELKYRPKHLFYVSGSSRIGPLTVAADFRYLSRIEEIDSELGLIIPDADERVAAYVTDCRLRYDVVLLQLPVSFIFSAQNLFNYNYSEIIANVAPIRNFRLTLESAIN